MTEAEWMACDDPVQLIDSLREKSSDRKFRLLAVAGCYACPSCASAYESQLEVVVRYTDGAEVLDELRTAWGEPGHSWPERPFGWAHAFATSCQNGEEDYLEATQLLPLIYDIFGNPFRPITFSSDWRTDTALTLAKQMYESRDFSAMPILADALQDAGCDNEDVLNHCRGEGPHVRGCWVLDLVLGQE